jgi:DNA repair and recombination RAD54-like protein
MVDFCNPGVLGTPAEFRRQFEAPILASREPGASDAEVALGEARSDELSAIVNRFILRRTNKLLSAHLPPKVGTAGGGPAWAGSLCGCDVHMKH